MSEEQISQPSLVLKFKVARFCINESITRILMHKECKCEEFWLQTRLVGEIKCSSDVVMYKGHYQFYIDNTSKNFFIFLSINS